MKIAYPFDPAFLLRKKNVLRRDLLAQNNLMDRRIALLGGSTTAEVADQLALFLLAQGIRPVFYQSEYGQYYEDALFPGPALTAFKPDLVVIHTTAMNIRAFPGMGDDAAAVETMLQTQREHFCAVWDGIKRHFDCPILQNNFEEPWLRPLGNLDASDIRGRSRFVARLNEMFAQEAETRKNLYINDIHYLSARLGLDNWFNPKGWYLYKYALAMEMIPHLAHQAAAVIAALWGKSHKCLVLDLDNTLWGGVIGDDGLDGICIGSGNAVAEAHSDIQRYAKFLKDRGIILAVCSKNEEENAMAGFTHQDTVLTREDFAAFRANWDPKSQNINTIAEEINIGIDSLVFFDDNPAERDIVRAQLPQVMVPEIGDDVTDFLRILDRAALFESISLSEEDLKRSQQYNENAQRGLQQAQFATYEDFLVSLEMKATIAPFDARHLERITQLINKTNQFNLTTRRYTEAEVENMISNLNHITLYGRLSDKFGDNGLISVVAGTILGKDLHIDLWLMSCRVLKRGMEEAMFKKLCQEAFSLGLDTLIGYYVPSAKNKMVAGLYESFGFVRQNESAGQTVWHYNLSGGDLSGGIPNIKHFIEVLS